jgi:hypothetical protein
MIVWLSHQCTGHDQLGLAAFDFDMGTLLRHLGRLGEQGRVEDVLERFHDCDLLSAV